MPLWQNQTCQRKAITVCAVTSLAVLVGLLVFAVIYLTPRQQDNDGEDLSSDHCTSKATVVTDEVLQEKWDMGSNFSEAWSKAEQDAREPAHMYMETQHSTAIYMYTSMLRLKTDVRNDNTTNRKRLKETFESRSLYWSLSEAVQILKHSQLTCLRTKYRTETPLNLTEDKLIRFSSFFVGSDGSNSTSSSSCFEIYTCFGADVTYYSASKQSSQVLIPPYEVFKVTEIETDTDSCGVVYRIRSNLNCVYDRESNMLHPISALPLDGFWLILIITCIIIVSLMLPFIVVNVLDYRQRVGAERASTFNSSSYNPVPVVV